MHSPAPWRIHVLTAGKDEAEILSALPDYDDCGVADVRYLADAALIAAAPEMLAMLKGIITVHPITREPDFLNANFHEIELLIAKAEQSQNVPHQTLTE